MRRDECFFLWGIFCVCSLLVKYHLSLLSSCCYHHHAWSSYNDECFGGIYLCVFMLDSLSCCSKIISFDASSSSSSLSSSHSQFSRPRSIFSKFQIFQKIPKNLRMMQARVSKELRMLSVDPPPGKSISLSLSLVKFFFWNHHQQVYAYGRSRIRSTCWERVRIPFFLSLSFSNETILRWNRNSWSWG